MTTSTKQSALYAILADIRQLLSGSTVEERSHVIKELVHVVYTEAKVNGAVPGDKELKALAPAKDAVEDWNDDLGTPSL